MGYVDKASTESETTGRWPKGGGGIKSCEVTGGDIRHPGGIIYYGHLARLTLTAGKSTSDFQQKMTASSQSLGAPAT